MSVQSQILELKAHLGNPVWVTRPIKKADRKERFDDALSALIDEEESNMEPRQGPKIKFPIWRGLWFWIWNKKIESHILAAPESLKNEGWVWYSHNALSMLAQAVIDKESVDGDDSASAKIAAYVINWPLWTGEFIRLVATEGERKDAAITHLIFMGWPNLTEEGDVHDLLKTAKKIDSRIKTDRYNHLNDLRREYRSKVKNIPLLVK